PPSTYLWSDTTVTPGNFYEYHIIAFNVSGYNDFAGLNATTWSASFVKNDTATQGSWDGIYGADGYNIIGDTSSYPSYAQVSVSGQSNWTWAASTNDNRALQKASNPSSRIASTWYSGSTFTVDVNLTDDQTHQVALYLVDWDSTTRAEQITITDAVN